MHPSVLSKGIIYYCLDNDWNPYKV